MLAKSESERQDLIPPYLPTHRSGEDRLCLPGVHTEKTKHVTPTGSSSCTRAQRRRKNGESSRVLHWLIFGAYKNATAQLCEAPSRGCILTTRIFVVDLSVSEEEISHRRDCGWVVLPYHDDYVRHVLFPPPLGVWYALAVRITC